jgi:hypothetical protein
MTTMTGTLPAQPLRQTFGSAFGAALFGGLLPLLMIAALFQA